VRIVELDSFGSDFNALLDELDSRHAYLQSENEFLAHQANHDSLTGLPNRGFFERRLTRAMEYAKKREEQVAVLFLDSDRFKNINDKFGHLAGDNVLVAAAKRMRSQLREDDLVARIGGDEFAILLWPIQKIKDAERIVQKISSAMDKPIKIADGIEIVVSFSIGIAVYPDDGDTVESLINVSDTAMYRSKKSRDIQLPLNQT
jgi:diguanylate cyclase (GGDEF)-like protein